MFPSILIVDDEPSILQTLGGLLSDEGFEVTTASNGYEALKLIETESPDLVLLDIWMPGIDGIATLKEIKKDNPNIQVIIITGHGTIETAVKATKLGAFDLIEKPLSIDKVIVAINNALNFRRLEEENKYLRKKTIEKNSISGHSPAVATLKEQIGVAAPTDSRVMISGENGTGKELVARTLHQLSTRANQPMIVVNCAIIPEKTIESELFGHEKNAFADAGAKKRGQFELANNGTIFLDEIGDMSLKTQAKILRFLEDQTFQRVGGGRDISVDVRIIAATNKDLRAEIDKGNFREDLFFRLNVIPIDVPPLGSRIEDVPILVQTFLDEFARPQHHKPKTMQPEAIELLCQYPWPGNVRELKNLMERLVIMVQADIICANDIPAPYNPDSGPINVNQSDQLFSVERLKDAQDIFVKEFIRRKMSQFEDDVKKAAAAIGVSANYVKKALKT
jgi:two-component system, NtrC family, nitrogen regulation response regulator NtrX